MNQSNKDGSLGAATPSDGKKTADLSPLLLGANWLTRDNSAASHRPASRLCLRREEESDSLLVDGVL